MWGSSWGVRLTSHHPFPKVSRQNLEFPVTPLPVNTPRFVKVGPSKVSLMIPVFLGGGFQYFCIFTPILGVSWSNLTSSICFKWVGSTTNQTTFGKHPHIENTAIWKTTTSWSCLRAKITHGFFCLRIEVENKLLGDPIEVAALRSIVTRPIRTMGGPSPGSVGKFRGQRWA